MYSGNAKTLPRYRFASGLTNIVVIKLRVSGIIKNKTYTNKIAVRTLRAYRSAISKITIKLTTTTITTKKCQTLPRFKFASGLTNIVVIKLVIV